MTISPSELKQVARSVEKTDDDLVIDLAALENQNALEILEGSNHDSDSKKAKNKPYFRSINLKKRHFLITVAFLVILTLIVSYADKAFRGESIANGLSVSGVDIGGQSYSSAEKELEKNASKAVETPLTFVLGNESVSVSAQDLDLKYNIDATLEKAQNIGESWAPQDVVSSFFVRYTTGEEIEVVSTYNKEKFDEVARSLVDTLSTGRTDAGVVIKETSVEVIEPKSGKGVSLDQANKALKDSISTFSRETKKLKSENVEATITLKAANETAKTIEKILETDSVLTTPAGNSITITPAQLRTAIKITPSKSNLDLNIDSEKLRAVLGDQIKAVESVPQDASFSVSGNTVSVIPSVSGKLIDFDSAMKNWIKGLHNFQVAVIDVEPTKNTDWAQKLNITEVVSSFSTNFPAGQVRIKNIRRAAEVTNNTIVAPGETFSLNAKLGRRTAENGYVKAPVYSDEDGFFEDFGGGASQFSTTLFNAAFIGGYQDVTHAPHSIYITRYPMGREATLNYGSIDMAFKNDTNSGLLIRTSVGATSVTAVIYGNKEGRTVKLEGPVELSRIAIETQYTDDPNLEAGKEKETQKGYPGIVVENYRTVSTPDKQGRRERYRWTYNMVPRKVIRGTKAPASTTPPVSAPA